VNAGNTLDRQRHPQGVVSYKYAYTITKNKYFKAIALKSNKRIIYL